MLNILRVSIGLLVAFLVGAGARWFDIPIPAPPTFVGAFLIVSMTTGWILTNQYLSPERIQDEQNVITTEQKSKNPKK